MARIFGYLKVWSAVVSSVDVLERRSEGNVRVVVDLDWTDVCLGVPGSGRLRQLEAVEEHLTVDLHPSGKKRSNIVSKIIWEMAALSFTNSAPKVGRMFQTLWS